MTRENARRPLLITALSILLFLFALLGSLFLWGEGFILQAPPGVDVAFPITDILVQSLPET